MSVPHGIGSWDNASAGARARTASNIQFAHFDIGSSRQHGTRALHNPSFRIGSEGEWVVVKVAVKGTEWRNSTVESAPSRAEVVQNGRFPPFRRFFRFSCPQNEL